MNQAKYRHWLRTQFVPVVTKLFGNKPMTSRTLRLELEDTDNPSVSELETKYREVCGSNGVCPAWKLSTWTDRVRRALEACVREGVMDKSEIRQFQRSGWSGHEPKKTVRVFEYSLI